MNLSSPKAIEATRIAHTLREHGYSAYLVGGCVRDLLLDREPADYDVVGPVRCRRARRRLLILVAVMAVFGAVLAPLASADSGSSSTPGVGASSSAVSSLGGAVGVGGLQAAQRDGPAKQIGPTLPPPMDPPVPANSGAGRRAVYCNSCQWVWIIDADNTVVRDDQIRVALACRRRGRTTSTASSPGRSPPTTRRSRGSGWCRSVWGPNGGGIGFHEIPWQYGHPVQTVEQLGQALSGGCVRQAHDDAIFMWNWSQIGDTVVVTA